VAPFAQVARQSIPRFDLYAALGVDPSADDAAIEAAYWDLFGQYGGDAEAAGDRRIVRARLAREWLTDPERRRRYDASRARAAARAATKAAGSGAAAGAAGAADAGATDDANEAIEATDDADAADAADDEEIAADTIPWPAADLARQAAMERRAAEVERSESSIAWSATPAEPDEAARPTGRGARRRGATRSERRKLTVIGWGAVIVAGVAALYLLFTGFGSNDVAVRETPTSPAATAAGPTPTLKPPTSEPTVAPTASAPSATPVGIDTAALQQASWQTLQALAAAAADGDVETAQTYLGDTAPDLRASGLRRATFPDVTTQQMTITQDSTGYVALADETTRLTSIDGTTWTFDYGERPLAVYRTAGSAHDLWWEESDGKHHLLLRATSATVSRTTVSVRLSWSFDPDDPSEFANAALGVSSVEFDGVPRNATGQALAMGGVTTLTPTAIFDGPAAVADELSIGITVTNPRSIGGANRAVETVFLLPVR
jgi:curved DNA-binding protein CbpA